VQIDSVNHLLLKDTPGVAAGAKAVLNSALNFHELMEAVEERQPLASLYILDACRDNPFGGTAKSTRLGELHGLAKIESVYGAFVMYSAGPDESALDSLPGERTADNSLYTRHLLALIGEPDARIVDVAKKVQIAVEQEARVRAGYRQRPAYFDGILGHFYFADQSNPFRAGRPAELANNENIVRLSRERQWGPNCESLPPPRIKLLSDPQYGRIITRFAKSEAKASFGNKKCDGTVQRGIELYYRIDDAYLNSDKVDRFQIDAHYSVDQGRTRVYAFEVDIPKKTSAYTVLRSR
jgi:Caspase domain